jgi:hypothetical protein
LGGGRPLPFFFAQGNLRLRSTTLVFAASRPVSFLRRSRSPESRNHRLQLQYKSKAVTLTAGRQRIISMTSGSSAPPRASFFRNLAIA